MQLRMTIGLIALMSVGLTACAPGTANQGAGATTDAATAEGTTPAMASDPDVRPASAAGLPSGYVGRVDRADAQLSDARYVVEGNSWEITTGPAHIVYSPATTATGSYNVSATFEQLERPQHPEAFGIFIGGRNLQGDDQTYTYFLVRGTGQAFAQRRDGANLTRLVAWAPNEAVPAADESGRQTYRLQVVVHPDSVRFVVNDAVALALPKGDLPTDGIVGLRVNHNLRLRVSPLQIRRE
jgi:hypothetical protein